MRLDLDEDDLAAQALLEQMLARVVQGAASPRAATDAVWTELVNAGWLGLALPEARGGFGGRGSMVGVLMESLGYHALTPPVFGGILLGARMLAACEASAPRDAVLAGAIEGRTRLALAYLELEGAEASVAHPEPDGWRLVAKKALVFGGETADWLLVTAQIGGELAIFLAPGDAAGLARRTYGTLRGEPAADIGFDVVLGSDALLARGAAAEAALRGALAHASLALCAEAVGAMRRLLELTTEHVRQRVQFGRPLAELQVVRHRIAEMSVSLETATAAVHLASAGAADRAPTVREVATAKATAAAAAEYVSQQAVQLHGAMGVTEELAVSRYFRLLTAFQLLLGDARRQTEDYAADVVAAGGARESFVLEGAGHWLNSADQAFRAEVRDFLETNLTPDLQTGQRLTIGVYPEPEVSGPWHRLLARRGWVAPLWPKAHGGCGWTPEQRFIFEAETARASAPLVYPMGVRLLGPVLIRFGDDAQKARYLPRILSGEDYWCQGYSEPGAGSDLASLQTFAASDGDDYVVNGSKIWTTHAHHASHIFMLVRTSREGRPQQGISFLLVDLSSPGIEVRPIRSMSGEHEVNQVFFTDVRVPKANRVGEENAGWACAKYLLEFERGAGLFSARLRSALTRLGDILGALGEGDLLDDPHRRRRYSELALAVDAFELLEYQTLAAIARGETFGPFASILKLRASRLKQAIGQTGLELAGVRGVEWAADAQPTDGAQTLCRVPVGDYLSGRANTIFGGAAEVQLDIIGRLVLGGG